MSKISVSDLENITRFKTQNPRYDVYQFNFDDLGKRESKFFIYDNYINAPISPMVETEEDQGDFETSIYSQMILDDGDDIFRPAFSEVFQGNKAGPNGDEMTLSEILETYQ